MRCVVRVGGVGDARAADGFGGRDWYDVEGRGVAGRPASRLSADNPLFSPISNPPERSEGGVRKIFNFLGRKGQQIPENWVPERTPEEKRALEYFLSLEQFKGIDPNDIVFEGEFLPIGQTTEELDGEIEAAFNNGNPTKDLVFDGVTYTGDGQPYDAYSKPMAEKHSPRATYKDGRMYARSIADTNGSERTLNGRTYTHGQVGWDEVLPVPKLLDRETGITIPLMTTISGIRYAKDGSSSYDGKYEDTNLYQYENGLGKWQGIGYKDQVKKDRAPMLSRTIPAGTTEIAQDAFNGCIGTREIRIPASVTQIGENAFANTKFRYISRLKCGDTLLTVDDPRYVVAGSSISTDEIVSTQDVSAYTSAFTHFDIGQLLTGGINLQSEAEQGSRAARFLQQLEPLVARLGATRDKLPWGFVQKLLSTNGIEAFANSADFKGFRRLAKLVPPGTNIENLGDFYTFAYNIGCFSRDAAFNQKACTWLEERVTPKPAKDGKERSDLPFSSMHTNFEDWKPEGENREFSEFLFAKNTEKKSTTFGEVSQEPTWGMFLKRIYDEFSNPSQDLEDGGRFRDKSGKLMFRVLHSSTNERGEDTSKPKDLKPTIALFKDYFASKKFIGIKTADDKAIAEELGKWSGMEQKHFDRAKSIMEEHRAGGVPQNIVGRPLVDLSTEIEEYKKQTDRLARAGIEAAQEIVGKLADTIGKEFTFEWLEKSDPKNFTLGLYANCCANLAGTGYGIMRSSFIHPDIQNLVINNAKGKPVAKSTLYVNREQGYGVFNNVEVSSSMSAEQKQEIYDAYKDGINAFAEEYNRQNLKNPIKKINVGMNLNDLAEQIKQGKRPSEILQGIRFGQYGISGQQYEGDWIKGDQYRVYDQREQGSVQAGSYQNDERERGK